MLALLSAGSNAHGQLGNQSMEDSSTFQFCSFAGHRPHSLPSGTSHVVNLAAGANHTLVLLEMEDNIRVLWGSGDGRKGQLGLQYQHDTDHGCSQALFRKIQLSLENLGLERYSYKFVAATWETSYVVLSCEGMGDVLISFGSDDYGDLGVNRWDKRRTPIDFHTVYLDHILPSQEVNIMELSSGQRHVIARLAFGSSSILVGWGTSRHGQLGQPTDSPFSPLPRIISIGKNSQNDRITSCSLGIQHSIILNDSGRLSGLGSDRKGQLQIVNTAVAESRHVKSVGCTWNGSYIVVEGEEGWDLHSSGSNSHDQLGWKLTDGISVGVVEFPPYLDSRNTTVEIACGSEHVLALITPTSTPLSRIPQVWGWGWNEHGNLGLEHKDDVPIPTKCWPASDDTNCGEVRGIWAGPGTSWICTTKVADDSHQGPHHGLSLG